MTQAFSEAFKMSAIEITGNALLFVLVFGMSATVDMYTLRSHLKNKSAILTGAFLQFLVLPLLGFLVVKIFKMDESIGITLLVLTSSPGGSYSNWWCSIFNADLALSVTMTAISTLLSVIMLPLNLLIYAQLAYDEDVISSIDWISLFMALFIVILAISSGLVVSAVSHSYRINLLANKMGNLAGISLVVFSFLMSNRSEESSNLFDRPLTFYVGVASPCVMGLIVANILTSVIKLNEPERVTVAIECCYQNVGIATSVALTMFKGDQLAEAMGVPLYYGGVEAIALGIYCIWAWRAGWTKAPRDESLWQVIFTSYEVLLIEDEALKEIEVRLSVNATMETESIQGHTMFHYFHLEEDSQKRKKKRPSGATLPHRRDIAASPDGEKTTNCPAEIVIAMQSNQQITFNDTSNL